MEPRTVGLPCPLRLWSRGLVGWPSLTGQDSQGCWTRWACEGTLRSRWVRTPHMVLYTPKLPLGDGWRLGARNLREFGLPSGSPDHRPGSWAALAACQHCKPRAQREGAGGVFSSPRERVGAPWGRACVPRGPWQPCLLGATSVSGLVLLSSVPWPPLHETPPTARGAAGPDLGIRTKAGP